MIWSVYHSNALLGIVNEPDRRKAERAAQQRWGVHMLPSGKTTKRTLQVSPGQTQFGLYHRLTNYSPQR